MGSEFRPPEIRIFRPDDSRLEAGLSDLEWNHIMSDEIRRFTENLGGRLSRRECGRVGFVAGLGLKAHRGQYRKNGITPYFFHPLDVASNAVGLFNVSHPQAIEAALLHDVLEDRPEEYPRIKSGMASYCVGEERQNRLLFLGVEMLSKTACADKKRRVIEGLDRLVDPGGHYCDFISCFAGSGEADGFIRQIHLVKLSDILSNTASLMPEPAVLDRMPDGLIRLPGKFLGKVAEVMIPCFVEKSRHLSGDDRRVFYSAFTGLLDKYAGLDDSRLGFLADAAKRARASIHQL
jgi:hypothetical protein